MPVQTRSKSKKDVETKPVEEVKAPRKTRAKKPAPEPEPEPAPEPEPVVEAREPPKELSEWTDEIIREIYNSPKYGLMGIHSFAKKYNLPLDIVKKALEENQSAIFNKPVVRRYQTVRTWVPAPEEQFQIDLAFIPQYKAENDNFEILFCAIDCFSRKAWVFPLKDKSNTSVLEALKKLLSETSFNVLQTDHGTEFTGKIIQDFLKEKGITFFSTEDSRTKSAIAERFIRTLKGKITRLFDASGSFRYIDALPQILDNCNNTVNRSIGMTPNQVNFENIDQVQANLDKSRKVPKVSNPKFQVGDYVRTVLQKGTFSKDIASQRWSHDILIIKTVQPTLPPTYKLKDYKDEDVPGIFYEQDLQKANKPEQFYVEKILARRTRRGRKEVLVKWIGYPEEESTWEPASEIPGADE
jgi:hypothetical protein